MLDSNSGSTDTITYSRTEGVKRELLSPREAWHALGMGQTRLYALLKSGELRSVKIGRSRRIARTEIERYVKSLTDS